MAIGVAVARVLEQSGQSGALREIELRKILAEERLRRFTDAINLITAAVAEVRTMRLRLGELG